MSNSDKKNSNFRFWEARATLAAPTYFPPALIERVIARRILAAQSDTQESAAA
ncbi:MULTISPECIES: hypothetical protein [Rhizobium]|uniref:hypothetical protein n=1 Tax=Rhizobium TaxID=379 RepID=UPI00040E160F|nr:MULTISPECIES: hypothetical protein [Rhizobium]MCA0800999.1 hypothetical protein [Rhizobium sp. T1473]MCS0458637.1 hypothetical protein [Rhizobium favelukesii]UFS81445.1 hypothetical protein LPB79_24505 [Rhizobium sp. T136]